MNIVSSYGMYVKYLYLKGLCWIKWAVISDTNECHRNQFWPSLTECAIVLLEEVRKPSREMFSPNLNSECLLPIYREHKSWELQKVHVVKHYYLFLCSVYSLVRSELYRNEFLCWEAEEFWTEFPDFKKQKGFMSIFLRVWIIRLNYSALLHASAEIIMVHTS